MPGTTYPAQAYFGQTRPPRPHWGVDSLTPANFGPVTDPQTGVVYEYFYDAVVSSVGAGRKPEFWGRYIGERGNLTQSEVDFLHCRNCKVLLIYRDTARENPSPPLNTYEDGVAHATQAITYIENPPPPATRLNVPRAKRVWTYADIEFGPTFPNPTAEFLRGWSDHMAGSPYGGSGGIYGNTAQPGFTTPYCDAYDNDPRGNFSMRAGGLLWTNQPNRCAGPPCDPIVRDLASKTQYTRFTPTIPTCRPPVVIYQYAIDLTVAHRPTPVPSPYGDYDFTVDFDLADERGFASMWGPPPRAWEAYLAFDDGGEEVSLTYPAMVRCIDELADGRIVIVFVTQRPGGNFLRALISADGGVTWTAKDELNLSTAGYGFGTGKYGGVIAWGGRLMAFFRRGQSVYRRNFDPDAPAGSQWAAEVAIITETSNIATAPLPCRSRDRSKAGVLYFITLAPPGRMAKWAFLDLNGNVSGATEDVDLTDTNALTAHFAWFQENNEPVYARRSGDPFSPFTDYGPPEHAGNGHVFRKIRSGVWPSILEQLESQGEPLTLVEQFALLTPGDTATLGQPAVYGGGLREQDGDFHSLIGPYILDNNNDYVLQSPQTGGSRDPIPPTFRWRRQENGTWKEDAVNFASRARPITARTYKSHQTPFFITNNCNVVGMVIMATSGKDFTKQGSKAWGPFMFAAGQQVQTDVSVPTTVVGEVVTSVTYDQPHGGATLSGTVSAPDTVTVTFSGVRNYDPNTDPPTPDIAAGTVTVKIAPHYTIWFIRRFLG